jgi:hypothetical protein
MRAWLQILLLLFITACSAKPVESSIKIFNYEDFGPQVVAHELIGMDWWQWQAHGDSRPKKYDIKVVVYKDTPLETVKKNYPVIPEKRQDYRYLEYKAALQYLNQIIEEDAIPSLTNKLKLTREKVLQM